MVQKVHVRVQSASYLQCHSDGGFISAEGIGSWGFTIAIWEFSEDVGWSRYLAGYGHGRFEGCCHSLHAELVAIGKLLSILQTLV